MSRRRRFYHYLGPQTPAEIEHFAERNLVLCNIWYTEETLADVNRNPPYADTLERFCRKNSDLPRESGSLHIMLYPDPAGPRIAIGLDANTPLEEIKANWNLVLEWRRRLYRWWGERPTYEYALFEKLEFLFTSTMPYKGIADLLNQVVVRHLDNYLRTCRGEQPQPPPAGLPPDHPHAVFLPENYAPAHAVKLLVTMGIAPAEAETWIAEMVRNLENGKPAFLPTGGPITRDQVISRMRRHWKQYPLQVW